jgi:hypothetical protein
MAGAKKINEGKPQSLDLVALLLGLRSSRWPELRRSMRASLTLESSSSAQSNPSVGLQNACLLIRIWLAKVWVDHLLKFDRLESSLSLDELCHRVCLNVMFEGDSAPCHDSL